MTTFFDRPIPPSSETAPAEAPAPLHYAVAVEGFSEFERSALASFFRLAAQRTPSYVHVADPAQSDFLIADADQQSALEAVHLGSRLADTVFVGARAPEGARAWLGRPIDPMHIVRELDSLLAQRTATRSVGQAEVAPAPALDLQLLDIDLTAAAKSAGPRSYRPAQRGGADRDVLVVEDSVIARKFLTQRLQRLGYRVHVAATGEEAIEMLPQQNFAIVFLDIVLGEPGSVDGLRVCQHIKLRARPVGAKAPAVVMVTGLSGESDRVRGSLAGCDAYLTKPLLENEFIATLRAVDPVFKWEQMAQA
ncbi:hypothetical protein BH11PSE9_BH11PSE9_33760 [soil metagenome]